VESLEKLLSLFGYQVNLLQSAAGVGFMERHFVALDN
jgi:hypothetical protein